jgi:hypothetical protein
MVILHRFRRTIVGESLTDQCDGFTQIFITSYNFNPNKIRVYINGQRLAKDVDFEIIDSDEFRIIHYAPKSYFILLVDYERA